MSCLRICVVIIAFLTVTPSTPAQQLIGTTTSDVEKRFGLRLGNWENLERSGFQIATDMDKRVSLFGVSGDLWVICRDGCVVAVEFRTQKLKTSEFRALMANVVKARGLDNIGGARLTSITDGEFTMLYTNQDGSAVLIMTDATFGLFWLERIVRVVIAAGLCQR